MKKFYIFIAILLGIFLGGCGNSKGSFIKDSISDYNATVTISRFTKTLSSKNYNLISVTNHETEAIKLQQFLKPTYTVTINNPKISTKLLECNPTMALELPIQIAVYNELNGTTHLAYTNPEYWSLKHNIKNKECIDLVLLMARDFDEATDSIKKSK